MPQLSTLRRIAAVLDEELIVCFQRTVDGEIEREFQRWLDRPGCCMQASGSYSNQRAASVDELMQEVLVALSPPETRWRLERLAKRLAVLRASDTPPRTIRSRRRRSRRPGWVLDAVCAVMADEAAPMRVVDIHAAVEASLDETVSANSVSWVLASHSAGASPLFVRVARGRYVLASAA